MDNSFSRYAIYFIADPESQLHARASSWLGWDCVAGQATPHPPPGELANPANLDIASVTSTPSKYGFHGTIKPPMRLAGGVTEEMLFERSATLASSITPVELDGLKIARLGHFLALVPAKASPAFAQIAGRFVTELDDLRAPLTDTELDRRRKAGLTLRQEALLDAWGYPYVLDEFRFHMTLSGALDEASASAAEEMLRRWLMPALPTPVLINRMAVAGESADGRFRVIRWLDLGDRQQGS